MKRWILEWLWRRLRRVFGVFIVELVDYAFSVKEVRKNFNPEELEKLRSAIIIIIEKVLDEDL